MKKRRFTAIIRVRACNTFVFFKKFNKKKLQHNISFHYQSFSPDNCPVLLRFSVTRFVLSFKIPQLLSPPQHIPHTYIGVFQGSFLFFLFFSNKITLPSAQQNEGLAQNSSQIPLLHRHTRSNIFFPYLCRLYTHREKSTLSAPTFNGSKFNFLEVQLNDHLSCLY